MQKRWRFFLNLVTNVNNYYVCMQVSANLADNNTPQLCLPKAQISDFLTFWGTREFIIAVSAQCSRIRTYFHTNNVLCVWLHLPPRSCLNLQNNTLQRQAVIPSVTYGEILLRYLSACRPEFGFSKTDNLRGMFSCRKSSRLYWFSSFCFTNREAKRDYGHSYCLHF